MQTNKQTSARANTRCERRDSMAGPSRPRMVANKNQDAARDEAHTGDTFALAKVRLLASDDQFARRSPSPLCWPNRPPSKSINQLRAPPAPPPYPPPLPCKACASVSFASRPSRDRPAKAASYKPPGLVTRRLEADHLRPEAVGAQYWHHSGGSWRERPTRWPAANWKANRPGLFVRRRPRWQPDEGSKFAPIRRAASLKASGPTRWSGHPGGLRLERVAGSAQQAR